jgi:hypothetical protein
MELHFSNSRALLPVCSVHFGCFGRIYFPPHGCCTFLVNSQGFSLLCCYKWGSPSYREHPEVSQQVVFWGNLSPNPTERLWTWNTLHCRYRSFTIRGCINAPFFTVCFKKKTKKQDSPEIVFFPLCLPFD